MGGDLDVGAHHSDVVDVLDDGNNGSEGEETMHTVWIKKFKLCPNRLHSRQRGENLE